jgi:predicted ATPase
MPGLKRTKPPSALPGSPFLTHVSLKPDRIQPGGHPFTLTWLAPNLSLTLTTPLTFLVGENGTGKSTLLEAIAWACGFGPQGGNRDLSFAEDADGHALGRALRMGWRQKVSGCVPHSYPSQHAVRFVRI